MNDDQWICCNICQNPNPMGSIECHACDTYLIGEHLHLYEETAPGVMEISSEMIFYDVPEE